MSLEQLKKELQRLSDKKQAKNLQRFFKTGKGEYGEGDIFLGIKVPITRQIVKKYWKNLTLDNIQELLDSEIHEHRLIGLLSLIKHYEHFPDLHNNLFTFYLKNTKNINNWDLVDLSAPNIVGKWLIENKKERETLYKLAHSKNLWERRISVISTLAFIKEKDFEDTIMLSEVLIEDKQDLIHKAVGWALREIGKRDEKVLIRFLDRHARSMPRTMLRYSLEKLSDEKRKFYMRR